MQWQEEARAPKRQSNGAKDRGEMSYAVEVSWFKQK
jgi:hypothetical protein